MQISYAFPAYHIELRKQVEKFDTAAQRVTRATMPAESRASGNTDTPDGGSPEEMSDAMVNMMLAQRAFLASLRSLQTSDQMHGEVIRLLSEREQ